MKFSTIYKLIKKNKYKNFFEILPSTRNGDISIRWTLHASKVIIFWDKSSLNRDKKYEILK
jgi:hypothetical protein